MAWGSSAGGSVDDLLVKAAKGGSLCILPIRRFTAEQCASLCTGLLRTEAPLEELLASGHAVGESGAQAVGALLAEHAALRRLALGDAAFGDAGVEALLRGLGDAPCRLEALSLDFKGLGEPGARAAAALLRQSATMRELTLARNPLGDGGVEALADALREGAAPQLEILDLSEVALSARGVGALAGAARAGGLRAVRTLRLCRNTTLGDDGARAVAALLQALPALRALWLEGCAVAPGGLEAVGAAAAAARGAGAPLDALHLARNLAAAAAPLHALAAAGAAGVASLALGGCGVADADAAALGEAHGLTALDLHSNELGPRAAAALGQLRTLVTLRLFDNPLGDGAALELVRALGDEAALTALDLGGCRLSAEGTRALCAALGAEGALPRLRCVELFGNECDAAAVAQLREARPVLDVAFKEADAQGAEARADGDVTADDDDDEPPPCPSGAW